MKEPLQPIYLARRSYRRRRMMDAARLLPALGVFLLALPMLWTPDRAPEAAIAREGIYLFTVWLGLIIAAFWLARGLAPVAAAEEGARTADGEDAGTKSDGGGGAG